MTTGRINQIAIERLRETLEGRGKKKKNKTNRPIDVPPTAAAKSKWAAKNRGARNVGSRMLIFFFLRLRARNEGREETMPRRSRSTPTNESSGHVTKIRKIFVSPGKPCVDRSCNGINPRIPRRIECYAILIFALGSAMGS